MIYISQIGCLLPALILLNLLFGWIFFKPVTWVCIGGILILLFIINSYIFVRRIAALSSKQGKIIDIEGEVVKEKKGKINLLYVITKLELGGAQKQLLNSISLLYKEIFTPFLFTCQTGLLYQEASSINGLYIKKSKFLERSINPLKDLLALIEIYFFIKKNNIDIVHTHSSKAGILGRWAARLAKVKVIIHTVHGWSFNDYQPRLTKMFFIWLERITAGITSKLIVVSNYDKEKGLHNGIGDNNKYTLIRYGIDYAAFQARREDIRQALGINADDLVVGMISCLKPQKCPQDFIRLASLVNKVLPKVRFILVGDGILHNHVEELINTFNLRSQLILTGWRKDIPPILQALDVFALTSLWEGLPISVLEAMAASKPVVATNTGGIAEVLVENKTGFLVAPGDIKTMSENLINLLRNKNLRDKIGQNAKNSLGSAFSLSNMVKHTHVLYLDLILSGI